MIRFKLYREFGALNSAPVFDALEKGIRKLGHTVVNGGEDVPVIWSVLWQGRMLGNQQIYNFARKQNRPILIIEVGNLHRGTSWRVGLNHINRLGYFGNDTDLDHGRPSKLNIKLNDSKNRSDEILITAQHYNSLQWEGQPPVSEWLTATVKQIREHTQRSIRIRPHPRSPIRVVIPGVTVETPIKLANTYDDYDINYNYHCLVNFNSGPAVQAAIRGVPVVCNQSSLAYPVSFDLKDIEYPTQPNREEWLVKLCHTEWTVDEIAKGIPLQRILPEIISQLNT